MEEATEKLSAAQIKLADAETELTEAKKELNDAKKKLATAEDELETAKVKLATAQTQYDNHTVDRPQQIINDYNRAQDIVTRCSYTVNSKESMVVSKQSVLTNLEIDARSLSAAAAPIRVRVSEGNVVRL